MGGGLMDTYSSSFAVAARRRRRGPRAASSRRTALAPTTVLIAIPGARVNRRAAFRAAFEPRVGFGAGRPARDRPAAAGRAASLHPGVARGAPTRGRAALVDVTARSEGP
jgi:hypothetical protein